MANAVLDLVGTPALVSTGTNRLVIGTSGAADLIFVTNGTERLRIDSNGQTTLAASIDFRLANNDYLEARNAANSEDFGVLKLDSSNNICIGEANTGSPATINYLGGVSSYWQINDKDNNLLWRCNNSAKWEFNAASALIAAVTSDAADTMFLGLSGGGAANSARGAFLTLAGNEEGSNPGDATLSAGAVSGGNVTILGTSGAGAGSGEVVFGSGGASETWRINSAGQLVQEPTAGSNVVLTRASTSVREPVANTLTAAGTTISDALQLTAVYNRVTTVAASTGVKLWDAGNGTTIYVQNLGANNLEVYPPDGSSTINGAAGGGALTLAAATDDIGVFMKVVANTWMGIVAAGPAT